MPRGIVTPSKRRRSRSKSRRRFRRRGSKRMASTRIYRRLPIGGFRPHHVVKLRYSDVFNLDPSSGGSGTQAYVFQANNIFDPDTTSTGHQPLYRDTWAGIYKSYIVLGAKIRLVVQPTQNVALINSADVVAQGTGYTAGVLLTDSSSDYPISTNTLIEIGDRRRCKFKILPPMQSNRFTSIVQTYSPRKFYGLKDTRDHLGELGSGVGSGPSLGAYFICFLSNADNSANAISIPMRAVIDYTVMFYDIIDNVTAS
nr:capsid protein [Cressdnaviricota sp.]